MHQVKSWLGPAVLLDVESVGSTTHHPQLWWTNLLPLEVLRRAYQQIVRLVGITVDSVLDVGQHAQMVRHDDRPPLTMVNKVGHP